MANPHLQIDLFDSDLPLAIALFDRQMRLVQHNRAWAQLSKTAAPSGKLLDALLPLNALKLQPFAAQALAGRHQAIDAITITEGDTITLWDITFDPHSTPDGAIVGFLMIGTDVTERALSQQLLEQRIGDRTRKLSALYDIMEVASEAQPTEFDAVLLACLRKVMAATHASGGAIQLHDADDGLLHLRAQHGLEPDVVDELAQMPFNEGLAGWTARHDERLVVTDVTADKRASTVIRDSDVNVYAGVPMNAKGRVVGVLSVMRERKRAFSSEDLALLGSVADQVGIVIENLMLRGAQEQLIVVEERNRLASELHDAVTQSLYSQMLFAAAARKQAEQGDLPQVKTFVQNLEQTAQQAIKEMRLLLHNLRPLLLSEAGLVQALRQRLEAVEGRANVKHELLVPAEINLPQRLEEAVYFICYEALNNALKHAQAKSVQVSLKQSDRQLVVEVMDDGIGFDIDTLADLGGMGMSTMRDRATQFDGVIAVNSAENQGTTVTIIFPLNDTTGSTQ